MLTQSVIGINVTNDKTCKYCLILYIDMFKIYLIPKKCSVHKILFCRKWSSHWSFYCIHLFLEDNLSSKKFQLFCSVFFILALHDFSSISILLLNRLMMMMMILKKIIQNAFLNYTMIFY